MITRPKCDFCEKKSDIFETTPSKIKIYYCGRCFVNKKYIPNETDTRPGDQWSSRKN